MEGAGIVRAEREIGQRLGVARITAGIAVLVLLAAIAVLLLPPYYQNWQLRQYVTALTHDPGSGRKPLELIQALVVDKAASMGLPVHTSDVHVTQAGGAVRIEVLYVVHIDLPVYTVDLHFRPGS